MQPPTAVFQLHFQNDEKALFKLSNQLRSQQTIRPKQTWSFHALTL